ncbi:SGNH/GDSL hydrolase family protein [Shewanella sp. MMG014]|uniref:SGNH/GDSL hydrolase family protein n=1 Tax=Shewanella sp. MMG014 TaxID=2822691 RepID=UPI001B38CD31|nr:SGNH/GDSL hydrolase family protein [Shewanella sp. MMG014]MBQ4892328.1 SGNH/GDSL hydrolase family protein [Shewanella sp. MMG014]
MHYLSLLLLWPVYLVQAIWVKKTTLPLPEATGLREGVDNLAPHDGSLNQALNQTVEPLNLLIVGDSAAAGVGVETQQQALTGQILSHLKSRHSGVNTHHIRQVHWQLIAKSGSNTQACVNHLNKVIPDNSSKNIDIAVLSLGVNDVLSPITSSTWILHIEQLCDLLKSKLNCQHIIITAVPPMEAFPALPQPFRWFLGARAAEFNLALHHWVSKSDLPCELLNMRESLTDAVMAEDGFHPSAEVYQHWGKMVVDLIEVNQNQQIG